MSIEDELVEAACDDVDALIKVHDSRILSVVMLSRSASLLSRLRGLGIETNDTVRRLLAETLEYALTDPETPTRVVMHGAPPTSGRKQ